MCRQGTSRIYLPLGAFLNKHDPIMRHAIRWGLLSWLSLWLGLSAGAQNSPVRPYVGYRLQVSNIVVSKRSDEQVKLSCDLINTGKYELRSAEPATRTKLVVQYDESLAAADLQAHREAIRAELLRNKLLLPPGRLDRARQYKINLPQDVLAEAPRLGLTRVAGESATEAPNTIPAPSNAKPRPKWARPRSSAPATTPREDGVGFQTKTGKSQTSAEQLARQKAACFDLVLEDVRILRQDKKEVEVRYTIVNQGKGTVDLTGLSPSDYKDNLAVKVYLSGVPQLSRGAMLLGGLWLDGELEPVRGKLKPGQSVTGELTMDIRKKTRYLNHLILGLDAALLIDECDRTNNAAALLLK